MGQEIGKSGIIAGILRDRTDDEWKEIEICQVKSRSSWANEK